MSSNQNNPNDKNQGEKKPDLPTSPVKADTVEVTPVSKRGPVVRVSLNDYGSLGADPRARLMIQSVNARAAEKEAEKSAGKVSEKKEVEKGVDKDIEEAKGKKLPDSPAGGL